MKNNYALSFLILATTLLCIFQRCRSETDKSAYANIEAFNDYWNAGQAEISGYYFEQLRYGEYRHGQVVLLFVTEDFSRKRLVKVDDPNKHKNDAVRVLKLNALKEFTTGQYAYAQMSSVFTPVDIDQYPHSLKSVSSTWDWCGIHFLQADWKGNRYVISEHTYFESPGDNEKDLMNPWLEDEIWTRIRIDPGQLPVGSVNMVAGSHYLRLSHAENKVYKARCTLLHLPGFTCYTVYYPDLKRSLTIDFENQFPHSITGWKEIQDNKLWASAHLSKRLRSAYWLHQKSDDIYLGDFLMERDTCRQ